MEKLEYLVRNKEDENKMSNVVKVLNKLESDLNENTTQTQPKLTI
jgi:hypothetical protein